MEQIDLAAHWIARASVQAAVLIALVLLLRLALGRRIPPAWWCALLLIAGVKFITPGISVPPAMSFWSWTDRAQIVEAAPQPVAGSTITRIVFDQPPLSSPPAHARTASPTPRPRQYLVLAWLAIAALLIARRFAREVLLIIQTRKMTPIADPRALCILRECAKQLHLRRPIRLLETSRVRAPAIWGSFRPVLFLPTGFAATASDSELHLIILHELLHIARCDVPIDRLIHIIRDIHWFNPLAWLWVRAYAADRELACDRAVLCRISETDRTHYGHCLLRIVEQISRLSPAPATIGMFHSKANLRRRITMISTFGQSVSRIWSVIALALLVLVGCAAMTDATQPAGRAQSDTPQSLPSQVSVAEPEEHTSAEEAAMRATLDRKLPELKLDQVAFSDVIDLLRNQSGANIFVNWRSLEAAGIDRNAPISARLRDIRFRKALSTILADVGGGTVKLGFIAEDGVITIATQDELHHNTITRVYDVRDLIVQPADFTPPNHADEQSTTQATQPSRQELIDSLATLILETVAPDTWRDNGGTIGSIRELSGQLIITQIPENQKQIQTLLNQLRESRAVQVVVEARFLTMNIDKWPRDLKAKLSPALIDKSVVFLEPAEADGIVKQVAADRSSSMLAAPRIVVYNGQRAYVSVGSPTAYVSNFTAIKASNGDTRFEPKMSTVDLGLLFDVTATASADRTHVTLKLNPRQTSLIELRPQAWTGAKGVDLLVQKPVLSVREAATTVSVPDGKVVALATTDQETQIEDPETHRLIKSDERLFVLVKPTLVIQREQPAPLPLKSSRF